MFFFIYCLFGWIWESCYVSARKRKWVNRGFLHGPLLPIYGFGAIAVLIITLPVQDNPAAVYAVGMIGATLLEYVTGAVMERLFHVKYWDYSNQKFNLNGYICLSSSVAWGFLAIGLIRYIQQPIAECVQKIPDTVLILADAVVFCGFCADVVVSAREAFDLKAIILAEKEKEMQLIQKSLALVMENLEENSQRLRENLEGGSQWLRENLEGGSQRLRENLEEGSQRFREKLGENSQRLRENLEENSQRFRSGVQNRISGETERLLLLKSELEQRMELLTRSREKRYVNAKRILKRNPSSTFKKKRILPEDLIRFRDGSKHDLSEKEHTGQ